jgi:hypothetical protein
MRKEDIKIFIDGIENPAEPNQALKDAAERYKSGLEYLISEILHEQETYLDEEGDLTDKPRIQYMNSFKSHIDLTKYVEKAREIDKKNN